MPLHTHVGSAVPDYGDLPGPTRCSRWRARSSPTAVLVPDLGWCVREPPRLTMVFAEQGSDWVPDSLQMMDNMYERMFRHEQNG